MPDMERLFARFNGNPPVTPASVSRFAAESRFVLPEEYVRFLRLANGGEGFVGPHAYVMLWRLEELLEFNRGYDVDEFAPGLFLFGSDGGGEAYAFDSRSPQKPIVSVPFVGMELDEAWPIGANFDEFLEALYTS